MMRGSSITTFYFVFFILRSFMGFLLLFKKWYLLHGFAGVGAGWVGKSVFFSLIFLFLFFCGFFVWLCVVDDFIITRLVCLFCLRRRGGGGEGEGEGL
jgi:hypothetical protein